MFSGAELTCLDAADVNDDGTIDVSDPIGTLGYLFLGTLSPLAPFRDCGIDPTSDEFGCLKFPACE